MTADVILLVIAPLPVLRLLMHLLLVLRLHRTLPVRVSQTKTRQNFNEAVPVPGGIFITETR
jgi:hypothetical protein